MRLSATHLSAGAGRGRPPFHPRQLFTSASLGFVHDPRVAGALFEESFGITPAVSGRPNGLLLDSRFNLLRGTALVTNGTFDTDISGWTTSGSTTAIWTPSGIQVNRNGVFSTQPKQAISLIAGKTYEVSCYVATTPSNDFGGVEVFAADGVTNRSGSFFRRSTIGPVKGVFTAAETENAFIHVGISGWFTGTVTIDSVSVQELSGQHAAQASAPSRPIFQSGPSRVVFDGMDDSHTTPFASALGSDCTVARAIPGTGAQILTGQTIGTTFTNTTTHAAMVVINRALTSTETSNLTRWLNRAAGL